MVPSNEDNSSAMDMELQGENDASQTGPDQQTSTKCSALRNCFHSCTRPCLVETHPLPRQASCLRRLADNFLCPPHSRMGAVIFLLLLAVIGWATLFSVTEQSALPGGNLFALFLLFIACWCGGYVVDHLGLPALLGMLIVGGILGNVPHVDFAQDIDPRWSSGCRTIALTVILVRAGLGLDPAALRRLSLVVLRLAFLPCLTEALIDGIVAHLILGLPWPWAFMLGFIIAAVSPAVVVPSLLSLSDRGYGLDKGVPTLIIAAASLDDVLSITGFGVLFGITFSTGNIGWTLVKGPLEAIVGILYGIVAGIIIWYIPQRSSKNLVLFRSIILFLFALMAVFGSKKIEWGGAGPLGALTLAFVAALKWRKEYTDGKKNPVQDVAGVLWMIFQPLLFGLIGAEVKVTTLEPDTVGLGVAVLVIGLVFRMTVSYLAVLRTNLNFKERIFVPLAWMPKATVQAAIGAVAFDQAKALQDDHLIDLGRQVLMMAVLVILITAPIGSVGISLAGPRMLKRNPQNTSSQASTDEKNADQVNGTNGSDANEVEAQNLLKR